MIRLILLVLLFGLSLLTVFRAPANFLWYTAIIVTEFPWILMCLVIVLLIFRSDTYALPATIIGAAALLLLTVPLIGAYHIGITLQKDLDTAFAPGAVSSIKRENPFQLLKLLTGMGSKAIAYKTLPYKNPADTMLTLDFYTAQKKGYRPCVVVVHGGSWAGGNSSQLPELNSYLSKKGYHVAAINYRLAPSSLFPAPVQDVQAAFAYLRSRADDLYIDTTRFILLGRSAGAQVALSAAYTCYEPDLKGVIAFYGPADMIWGYGNPANKWVMDSKKVMETYLGGTYQQVPGQYALSSPIELLTAQSPPTLLIHGKNDPLVAYEHSIRLSRKLIKYGVPHYLLTLPWATHACDYTLNGPGGQLSTYAVERFIQLVTR